MNKRSARRASSLENESLADAVCARINCRNISTWLHALAATLGVAKEGLTPTQAMARYLIDIPHYGWRLVLSHPHAGETMEADADRWRIVSAQFGLSVVDESQNEQTPSVSALAQSARALPFGLVADDTPASAEAKLGPADAGLSPRALAANDFRQSYFLDNAIVMEILWRPSLQGIEHVSVVRLGVELLGPLS